MKLKVKFTLNGVKYQRTVMADNNQEALVEVADEMVCSVKKLENVKFLPGDLSQGSGGVGNPKSYK